MRPPIDTHLRRLYAATILFGIACGISLSLTPLYLNAHGFRHDIGTLSIFFASGLVLSSIPTGALVRRFSGKHVLTGAMLGYSLAVALFPFASTYAQIAAVRFFDGACSMGIWVSAESIVLSRADKENKAYLTTLYAICLGSGYVMGPLFSWAVTHYISDFTTFLIGALFALASAAYIFLRVPVDTLAHGTAPADEKAGAIEQPPHSTLTVLWRIKNSCFSMFAYGYFQASVVLYLPLFLSGSKGIPEQNTKILVALFCFGMLTWSNIAGRIADRVGHLKVMRVLAFVGLVGVFGFVFINAFWLMCLAVFIGGGAFGSMSGVSLALLGVLTEKRDYSRANAIYNVFYATGMLVGPPISGVLFESRGGETMMYHHAGMWITFVLFTVIFMYDDPAARRKRDGASPVSVRSAV